MEKGLKIEQIAKICGELIAKRDPEEALEYVEDNLKKIPKISLHKIHGNLIAELNKDAEQTLIFCNRYSSLYKYCQMKIFVKNKVGDALRLGIILFPVFIL